MVALHESRLGQLLPAELVVEGARRLERDVDVAALECQAEAGLLVFDEVERHFGVAFLLQIRDDALADEHRVAYHVQDLELNFETTNYNEIFKNKYTEHDYIIGY